MAQYTIEDIEILRQKGGLSYEEAVNLLEYHNGSLARALVDMEKNGRIKDTVRKAAPVGQKKASGLFATLYRTRIMASKGSTTIVNLSLLFVLLVLLFATWVAVAGFILALVLGYRISFERNSSEFSDSWNHVVKNAANNAKSTMYEMAAEITGKKPTQPAPVAEPQPIVENHAQAPASGTTPVNVQFPGEGSVNVRDDADGFHEAEIR